MASGYLNGSTRRPLLAATKLSDYQIKNIIRRYAEGQSATDAAREMQVGYLTIRRTFDLTRRRMLDLGIYKTWTEYCREMEDLEKNGIDWYDGPVVEYVELELGKRPGVTAESKPRHTAELLYRFDQGVRFGPNFARIHYAEIVALVRLSGPLNRDLTPMGNTKAQMYLMDRFIDEVGPERRRNAASNKRSSDGTEEK